MTCEELEIRLSGYLDNELPQQEIQGLEVHLEGCPRCRKVLEELRQVKQATETLELEEPTGEEWDRMESRILESLTRSAGWLILIVWAIVTAGYATFQYAVNPTQPLLHKLLVFSLFLGAGLIFLSVLLQRLRERRTDRYRGVLK